MNIMRKLRGASGAGTSEEPGSAGGPSSQTQLGLMHLKKLFSEYTHPQQPLTDEEKDDKLYNMLPLFCKVFGSCSPSEMNIKFWDILGFCQQVSKLMVTEISKRASNQSTVVAALAIVKFLEIENSEESSNGWMLLSTLNLLAAGDRSLIQVMTAASIPSTLVRCLYLFFDLPEVEDCDQKDNESEYTPRERRLLLQKVFVQVLVKLCSYNMPCEQLARKDDLSLLFPAVTSGCAPHNAIWRKSAAEVLVTLSRHGLTPTVVQYIHNKGCIAECVENMQRIPELTALEVVEMFVAVFCVLKDSSEVSQLLLDDFKACHGYVFLSDFLLKHERRQIPDLLTADGVEEERMGGGEGRAALRNLVLMVSALCSAGHNDIKPARDPAQLYKLAGFQLPRPTNQGSSVKNVQAFQVLQTVFLKSSSPALCCTILDAISSVYHSDNANYFILESQNTLSQFAEKIHYKNREIQEKFFELVEFLVFQLNFVPCKELISLSLLLKANASRSCSILCMRTLLNILRFNTVFKDVYRDVGMLEVLVTCLTRYAVYLKDKEILEETLLARAIERTTGDGAGKEPKPPDRKRHSIKSDSLIADPNADQLEMELGGLVMECITTLLHGNASNCNVFRECGGAKCVHGMCVYRACRSEALGVIHELIVSGQGEEDMACLLNGMHAAPKDAYQLKLDILQAVLNTLRESHRSRTIFRKVSGFVYVTSILVSLENKLGTNEKVSQEILSLVHSVFFTISTAMRFEPANAKFFHQEICMTTLCDTIRLLGCFTTHDKLSDDNEKSDPGLYKIFYEVFTQNLLEFTYPADLEPVIVHSCLLIRLLYDVALDSFDKPVFCPSLAWKSGLSRQSSFVGEGGPRVVHAGAAVCAARLLPSLPQCNTQNGRANADLLAHVIRSLVRSERNQQTLCMGGLGAVALQNWAVALTQETHSLHSPLQYTLERLAAHFVTPDQLRDFLRMGDPLNCVSPKPGKVCKPGGPVPLTRIKTLVSMTTPKDYRSHGTCTQPPFVEFDMSAEGFGCLYLPHIAPQSVNLNALGAQDMGTFGGIGTGARSFPSPTGLSFSTWVCIDKYSDAKSDPHGVRLLTLVRSPNNRPEHLVCLSLMISAYDKAIIVCTQETLVPNNVGDWEPEGRGNGGTRVHIQPELLSEGVWHHIVLVLSRQLVLDNSQAELYIDGQHIHSCRMQYISCNPGGGGATLSGASAVYALVGTPPPWRRYSKLTWRQGPCLLLEEAVSAQTVSTIHHLGPHYIGTLQAPPSPSNPADILAPLVNEERVVFGINARAMSLLTLAKIRKVYSKSDNKAIARQLGMSSHENATPIRVLHNAAAHLGGPARCLGGCVVGYLGVRVFCPKPASIMVDTVGGCSVLLGLIAMAQDVECLYAGVKALVCVVRANKSAQAEMDRRKGYQTLAMLLKKKRNLLNSHILHLIFGLVGTVDSQKETNSIPNLIAFQDLICELEVWIGAPGGLIKSLLEHLLELATETSHKTHNVRTMRELHLVAKLLYSINDVKVASTRNVLLSLLSVLLGTQPRPADMLCLGQYMSSTIPPVYQSEQDTQISESEQNDGDIIVLRNNCFQMLYELLYNSRGHLNNVVCEEVSRVLGHDWLLIFMLEHVHSSTNLWALRCLTALCAGQGNVSPIMQRVRGDSSIAGGWLRLVHVPPHQSLIQMNAFTLMQWLGPPIWSAERIYLLVGLILGTPCRQAQYVTRTKTPGCESVNVQTAWLAIGENPPRTTRTSNQAGFTLTPDPLILMLKLIRCMVHCENCDDEKMKFASNCVEIVYSLYHCITDFPPMMMSADVLTALASILFPPSERDDSQSIQEGSVESNPSSPVEETDWQQAVAAATSSNPAGLTNHPVREQVLELMRTIVLHSLPLSATRQPPMMAFMDQESPSLFCNPCSQSLRSLFQNVIDMVLDASPPNSTHAQQVEYQTEVLQSLMDHLLMTDVFSSEANIANVCYLTARLVDKMWQGLLSKDPHDVFDFIVKLVMQAKKKSCLSLENLHHCLNRTILYLLSRPTDTIADQMAVLEALHKLTNHRLLIFGAGNHSLEFVGCLTYCLLQLSANMKITLDSSQRTTWHVNPSSDLESQESKLKEHQGHKLMMVASRRVWEELYACKKPAIEEALRVTLPPPGQDLPRDLLAAPAQRVWRTYLDNESKAPYRVPWEVHNQIQSKIQKVTGGLTRLASRTKVKKEDSGKIKIQLPKHQALQYMIEHVQLVRGTWSLSRGTSWRYVEAAWRASWAELVRERGLWGRENEWRLTRWRLHTAEGPARMRQILVPNPLFYLHYPPPGRIDNQTKYKTAVSLDSEEYYSTYGVWRAQGTHLSDADLLHPDIAVSLINANTKETLVESPTANDGSPSDLVSSGVVSRQRTQSNNEGNDEAVETEEDDEPQASVPDNQTLLRLLEPNEKVSHTFRCARIQGLGTTEGLLLFGREHCYVVDGFTILKNREIRDLDSIPDDYEPILPSQVIQRSNERQCSKFLYEDIREVHKRRYLLQPMALEVFFSDGSNYLLAFPRKVRNKVLTRLSSFATALADSAAGSVAGQKRGVAVEQSSGLLATLIGDTSVTQRWLRGEITNFQYLMYLNTLAGRSYNDLMQYPVFPWILADYDSQELDLTNPATFRDLSKPMGAQTVHRRDQFRKRFKEWDEPHGETPPYHYGTHYSSAMIVCSYLVRMEPFTQHFLRLQGGHFDLADRMFHSVKEAWNSASKHNMADVKELIPEFFYLPEFMQNMNNFDFGCKQSGERLGDILLPPWAKGDPHEFIRQHRAALESDYVSARLHHWIDLIFGYKQRGPPAQAADNVFHHLFYEGNVDIDNIDDPLKKNATIGFINNFGQIPKQLFKKAHPSKKMSQRSSTILDPNSMMTTTQQATPPEKLFFHNIENLRPSLQPIKEIKGPVGQIIYTDKAILAVEQNKVLMPPTYTRYVAWGFADHSIRIANLDNDKVVLVSESVAQACGEVVACVCPTEKTIITAGTSTVVTVWQVTGRRLNVRWSLYAHRGAVSCLAASASHGLAVSGSRDCTAVVWDYARGAYLRSLRLPAPITAVAIHPMTGDIATCSGTWVHHWSVNGVRRARVCVSTAAAPICVAFSIGREWDQFSVLLTGSADGVVRMWSVEYIEEKDLPNDQCYPEDDMDKSAMSVNGENLEQSPEVKDVIETEADIIDIVTNIVCVKDQAASSFNKSGSDSSLSDACEVQKDECISVNSESSVQLPDDDSSTKAVADRGEGKSSTADDTIAIDSSRETSVESARYDSIDSPKLDSTESPRYSNDSKFDLSESPRYDSSESISGMRSSKSDTSLSDSFVMVPPVALTEEAQEEKRWITRLICRGRLTMHTAFERRDNASPAPVTALAAAKNGRALAVGDRSGRIFRWCVPEGNRGGPADHWVRDESATHCYRCQVKFSALERKHHCRSCGRVVCGSCSKHAAPVRRLRALAPVRVCKTCHQDLAGNS